MKRPFDLLLLLASPPFWLPLLTVLALLVRVRLGAPILFRQSRPGKGGVPFQLLKFRTMTDARDAQGNLLSDAGRLASLAEAVHEPQGRARHSVRAAGCLGTPARRARSDAPYLSVTREKQAVVLRQAIRLGLPLVANRLQAPRPEGYFADAYRPNRERQRLERARLTQQFSLWPCQPPPGEGTRPTPPQNRPLVGRVTSPDVPICTSVGSVEIETAKTKLKPESCPVK